MTVQIIENAIPQSLCRAAEAAWPSPEWPYWHRYNGATANKFGSMDRSRIPPACLAALDALALAVIPHLGKSFVDYDLHAAGMHMMPPGGFLGRHLDAECHPLRPWRRTHSIVMFVNAIWGESQGGELVIGNEAIEVAPGTAAVFTTDGAWHHVNHVSTHSTVHRKTLALFAWQQADCDGVTSATFKETA
jgi:hypothetical protein